MGIIAGTLIIAAVLVVKFLLGQSAIIEVHDNLDSSHTWLTLMHDNDLFFVSSNTEVPILSGMGRDYFMSELQLSNFLYVLLSPFEAHYVNFALKVFIGFTSFTLLAKHLYGWGNTEKILIPLIATAYALLPGYENLYLAQASLPLVFFLYFKHLNSHKLWTICSALFYPVLSEFPRYGIFICAILGVISFGLIFFNNKYARSSFTFLFFLIVGYLVTDYRIFRLMLFSDEVTIRSEFASASGSLLNEIVNVLAFSQYHAQSKHFYIIAPTCLAGFFGIIHWRHFKKGILEGIFYNYRQKEFRYFIIGCFLIFFFAVVYGIYYGTNLRFWLSEHMPMLSGFNFSRFIWLNPLLWYLIFTLSVLTIRKTISFTIATTLTILQILVVVLVPSYGNDLANTLKCQKFRQCPDRLTYKQFYSVDLFNDIKTNLNYKNTKVVAYGMHPSVLSYNGFYTADGYHNNYSIDYKKEFRELISPALDRSERSRNYFDHWGGRAYLFSPDIDYSPASTYPNIPVQLYIDFEKLVSMEIEYILSLYKIANAEINTLNLLNKFENKTSPYKVYVYKSEKVAY